MDEHNLLYNVSNKIDDFLTEANEKFKLKNVEWEIFTNENANQIEITLDDFGTGGGITANINKEDMFCASMIADKNKSPCVYSAISALIVSTLLSNLALAGVKSLTKLYSANDLKFFLDRIKRKEDE